MLKAIGARSIDDLFAQIPPEYRLNRALEVPRQMAESEIVDWFRERSRENGDGHATFLGAGASPATLTPQTARSNAAKAIVRRISLRG